MRAVVQDRYGPPGVLRVGDVARPVAGEGEVLVRVRAASVHADVWHMVSGRPYVLRLTGAGLRRPRNPVPGTDVAGVVAAVGAGVAGFAPGDEVFGETITGYAWKNGGAFAEYARAPAECLAAKPPDVSFEQAAAVPTVGFIALQSVRGRARPGAKALINGAGGGVGAIALQLAKAYGAEVTGVDCAAKLDMLRSLGADHVIDYAREDFTRNGERYDLVVDIPVNHSLSECRRALTADGTYVFVGHDHFGASGHRVLGSLPRALKLVALSPFVRQLPRAKLAAPSKRETMAVLQAFLRDGRITPVIDRTFGLEAVPEAIRYMARGGGRGRVVIAV